MQVYIGIDWSEKKHDAVFVNEAAAVLAIVTFEHTPQGLAQLETVRGDLGVDPKDGLDGVIIRQGGTQIPILDRYGHLSKVCIHLNIARLA